MALPYDPFQERKAQYNELPLNRSKLGSAAAGSNPVIIVSCGSFSPPTFMHLRLFESAKIALEEAGLNVIGGFMSPVHDKYGKKGLVAVEHRIAMVEASLASSSWISCDTWEAKQDDWTRTRFVLERFAKEASEAVGQSVRALLLCGADLLQSFLTPGVWTEDDIESILSNGVACIHREGLNLELLIQESDMLYAKRVLDRKQCLVYSNPVTDFPTTNLFHNSPRRLLKRGQSIKYLLADSAEEYIRVSLTPRPQKHGLYQE